MNTNQLKKFAKEARLKLITQIGVKLDFVLTQDTAELRGKSSELAQLRSKLSELGREQLIETVAYTWFNRIMALRFMDANSYNTPKVVTPLPGMSNPEILQNALGGNIEDDLKIDRQRLNDLIDGRTSSPDAQTEVFKMLLVASCNKWHSAMPFMFERISDYTELLLPDDLLSDFSFVSDIRNGMSDDDCQEEELIGWLYQFYISDKKDDVFEALKKNIKITAENIPAATQLFTPRWIVRYMVENTLGKLWLSFKPESKIRQHMPYFIEAPEGDVKAPIPIGIKSIKDVTFIDPCLGSGHVLVYAFDLLIKIYEEEGFNSNEIPSLILENNLYGIDIDHRASQLAAFALTMKARGYYSRYLRKPVSPNVIALENINEDIIKDSVKLPLTLNGKIISNHKDLSLYHLNQAENLGSLIHIEIEEIESINISIGNIWEDQTKRMLLQARLLGRKYMCVCTNPPYMSSAGMNLDLKNYVEKYFPLSKSDLMATFIERCNLFRADFGFAALINQHTWMFLTSYENLRNWILDNISFESMLHLGPRTFPEIGGEVVQNTAFVFSDFNQNKSSQFLRLVQFNNSNLKEQKVKEAICNHNNEIYYEINQNRFKSIPSTLFGYWLEKQIFDLFSKGVKLGDLSSPRKGLTTAHDEFFLKFWYEVDIHKICFNATSIKDFNDSGKKFAPINKGGGYRKWYGNLLSICNWENDGYSIKNFKDDKGKLRSVPRNLEFNFKEGITWNYVSSNRFCCRYIPPGIMFSASGPTVFDYEKIRFLMGYLNSNVSDNIFRLMCPTLMFEVGTVQQFPVFEFKSNEIDEIVKDCIRISKNEWDFNELSWNFMGFPIRSNILLKTQIDTLLDQFLENFIKLKNNEEKLNKVVRDNLEISNTVSDSINNNEINLYSDELEILDGDIINKNSYALLEKFISFSVGTLFGRYTLSQPSLTTDDNNVKITTSNDFVNELADEDNIIPFLDGEWFNDDIVGRFKYFLKVALSEEYFELNLKYIEEILDKEIRKYFVKDFYGNHIKRYKKRPIYWMFSSPKGHFKALIYMHRYQPDLCSKMLNDYLQPFIGKLEAAKQTNTLLALREDLTAREKTIALKEVDRLELMIRDCKEYERTLFTIATQKIIIDLDDGVKVNYLKFKEVLVPIKGLEKEED
jgi:hypothetical protein